MSALRRPIASLLVSSLAVGAGLALATAGPAHAADRAAANKAAHWLADQAAGGLVDDGFSKIGASADALIAFASADDPALQPAIDAMLAAVQQGAAEYVGSGGGAAAGKLAIVAAAYDIDPTDFGGVDLVAKLKAGVDADGAVGPYPAAFGSGLAMAGFERAGAPAPAALTTWLVAQQNADGGFSYAKGQPSDADNTGLAIVGLATDDSAEAKAALVKALDWADGAQQSDGSWAGWVPVNSTCVLGSALLAAGVDDASALAFVKGKQLADGAITDGDGANLMATSQCAPFLGGVSYLDVEWTPKAQPKPEPKPEPKPSTATPTKPAPSAGSTTVTVAAPAPAAGRGVPARTGADDKSPLAAMAVGGVLVAAGLRARRRA